MSLTWANAAKKRELIAKGAKEVEEGGAVALFKLSCILESFGLAHVLTPQLRRPLQHTSSSGRMQQRITGLTVSLACIQKLATVRTAWTKQLVLQRTTQLRRQVACSARHIQNTRPLYQSRG